MTNLKDKISPGEWYPKDHYIAAKGRGSFIGQSFIINLPGPHNNFEPDAEGIANTRLWAASKEMLDILERFAGSDLEDFDNLRLEAINLLKQLNQ